MCLCCDHELQLKAVLQQKCVFVVDESEAVTPAARGLTS